MHTIRLRRPWSRSLDDQAESVKVDAPDLSPPSVSCGQSVCYRRSFNCPTGLGDDTRVYLELKHFRAESIVVRLNAESLELPGASFPIAIEITSRLRPTNRLELILEAGEEDAVCLDGEVNLQIESTPDS